MSCTVVINFNFKNYQLIRLCFNILTNKTCSTASQCRRPLQERTVLAVASRVWCSAALGVGGRAGRVGRRGWRLRHIIGHARESVSILILKKLISKFFV